MVAIGTSWTTIAQKDDGRFHLKYQMYYANQSVANNTTTVYRRLLLTIDTYGAMSAGSYSYSGTGMSTASGGSVYLTAGDHVLISGSGTVTHNNDGTWSQAVTGTANFGNTYIWTTPSTTATLPTIPRTSTPTLSASSVEIGNNVTINTNRASTSFTHDVTAKFGSSSTVNTIATGVTDSTTFNSATWASGLVSAAGSAASVSVTFTVTTKSGSTVIGSKTVSLTVTITPSVPTLSASKVEIGNAVTLNTNRLSTTSARTHSTYYKIGSSGWKNFATNVGASVAFNTWSYVSAIVGAASSGATTVTLSCDTYVNGVNIGSKQTTLTVTITPSAPTLNKSSITVGATVTLSTNRLSTTSARTHTVVWKIGSTTLETDSSVTTSCSINTSTYSAEIMTAIGSTASSGTVTATVTTYVNGGSIGSKSVSFTANVNTSAYKPTITFGTLADTNDVVKNYHGADQMINLMSNLSLPITFGVTATQGMALKSYRITFGTTSVSNTLSGTSGSTTFTYNGVQTNTITVTVTDARGTSASATKTFTLLDYEKPTITKQEVSRISMTGTDAGFTLEGTAYAGTYSGSASVTNSLTIKYTVTPVGGSSDPGEQEYTKTFSGSGSRTWSQSSTFAEEFDNDKQYDIKFTVSDAFSTLTSSTLRLYNGLPVYGWGEDHFDVYGDLHLHKRSDAAERWVLPEALDAILENGGVKNILPQYGAAQYTTNGITFTRNADGSVTCNGTATSPQANYYLFYGIDIEIPFDAILTGPPLEAGGDSFWITVYDGVRWYDAYDKALIPKGTTINQCAIIIKSGTTVNNLTFYPMLRDARFASDDYVPYALTNLSLTPADYAITAGSYVTNLTNNSFRIGDVLFVNCWFKFSSTSIPGNTAILSLATTSKVQTYLQMFDQNYSMLRVENRVSTRNIVTAHTATVSTSNWFYLTGVMRVN